MIFNFQSSPHLVSSYAAIQVLAKVFLSAFWNRIFRKIRIFPLIIFKVLDEGLQNNNTDTMGDGKVLARRFVNRTFVIGQDTPITLDPVGQRRAPMAIQQFNGTTGEFEFVKVTPVTIAVVTLVVAVTQQ
jgi:hypothetical protein